MNETIKEFDKWLIHQHECDVNKRGMQVCNIDCRQVFNSKLSTLQQRQVTAWIEAVERKRVKEKDIRRFDNDPLHPVRGYKVGYNQALDDVLSILKKGNE